jgi:hypothetical protein
VEQVNKTTMLDNEDLAPADRVVLDMLQVGRVTAPYISAETEYSLQYTRDRLKRLCDHDHVEKIHSGLYELIEDPRTEVQATE